MVVQLPSRANMILMLWIVCVCFSRLLNSVFTLMFSVAPLVKLMFCFLQWLGALLCHGEIKGFHWKICRCIVVLFYLFNTKQYNNSNWTVGSCVSENLTCWTPSETFLLPFTNYFIYFLFSCISENVSMYKYITFIHVLHRLFNTYYMLDASLNFVYNK